MMDNPTSGNVFGNANSGTVEKKFSASDWNSDGLFGTENEAQLSRQEGHILVTLFQGSIAE